MTLRYLKQLQHATFPLTVTDPEEIRQVEMLRAALLVNASVQNIDPDLPPRTARVLEITNTGHFILKRMKD
ncbi:hypothetical protein QTI51_37455 [Variovorax sp. J22G73]|uniref:hypothetical protein n=1 Tax=unclassified Variovorax TaxID=663243 RepID=UPI002578725E|nr:MULTISPECIES: hypothetical protein [unclassified Variovorax]MDM0103013.1 hypothetical protein [Variovorax sp. J22G73]